MLRLTEAARPVLKSEVAVLLAVPRLEFKPDKKKSQLAPANYDRTLFTRLKHLRKVLAEENEVPPYVVFSDATLIDMADILPTSYGEMLAVSGVGQRKLEKYADQFLDLIQEHITGNG